MEKGTVVTIPNIISVSRIFLSPLMYFLWENSVLLFIWLIVIGFTDIFDGYMARKLKKQTILGTWLDSIADFVFFISFIVCAAIFESEYIVKFQYFIGIIVVIKVFSGLTGLIRFKQPGFLHTIGNKIATMMVIIGICIFVLFRNTIIIDIGLYISILSALEEFCIILIANTYKPNIKGIWENLKGF